MTDIASEQAAPAPRSPGVLAVLGTALISLVCGLICGHLPSWIAELILPQVELATLIGELPAFKIAKGAALGFIGLFFIWKHLRKAEPLAYVALVVIDVVLLSWIHLSVDMGFNNPDFSVGLYLVVDLVMFFAVVALVTVRAWRWLKGVRWLNRTGALAWATTLTIFPVCGGLERYDEVKSLTGDAEQLEAVDAFASALAIQNCFEQVVGWRREAVSVAQRRGLAHADAEDVVQTTMLKVCRKGKERVQLQKFFFASVARNANDPHRLRKQSSNFQNRNPDHQFGRSPLSDLPDVYLADREEVERDTACVASAFKRLSQTQQTLILETYLKGQTVDDLPPGLFSASRATLHRQRKQAIEQIQRECVSKSLNL